ncbi:SDR family NAD(P)-dependent oxidoreductase [Chloroflexota bacterium]
MSDRLKGKVAVVTGAGRGIGRGEALALASEGARVIVNDLGCAIDGSDTSSSPANDVVAEIKKRGGEAVANYDSVATFQGGENIVKTAVDTFGQLDILVNNAGIRPRKKIWDMTEDVWDAMIKTHLYGHFFTTRHACILFRQQRSGRIINTSSESGLGNILGTVDYSAAKEGIIGFTRQLARDMAEYGVTCNAIRPGGGTRMIDNTVRAILEEAGRPSVWESAKQLNPDDVGPLVVWLASDDAANVNGRTFLVYTGRISLYSEPVEWKTLVKDGSWTIDEMFNFMPSTLAAGLKSARK